jgi:hypothetical protein
MFDYMGMVWIPNSNGVNFFLYFLHLEKVVGLVYPSG